MISDLANKESMLISKNLSQFFVINQKYKTVELFYVRVWIEPYLYTSLYARFDRVAIKLLSLLCTFENSSKLIKISIDLDSFLESLKCLLGLRFFVQCLPANFGLLMLFSQNRLIILLFNSGLTISKCLRQTEFLQKITLKSGLKRLKIKKQIFRTENDVFLTYLSQNLHLSSSNLPLKNKIDPSQIRGF